MILSDVSVKRPVFASVLSLLLVAFGVLSFFSLPLREYPDIDPPIVSVEVNYPGASANVVETRITQLIEDRIAGVEGIRFISSSSVDGESSITIEFSLDRDIDSAANDIRDRVSGVLDNLPEEADPPEIQKVGADEDVIIWFSLVGEGRSLSELTDFAERFLVDRFSILDGVARVQVSGAQTFAMRIWIDREQLAARGLTVSDVEEALRAENVELPAGSIESLNRQYTIRLERAFQTPNDFRQIALTSGESGEYIVRLGDVARVERGTVEDRTFYNGNGKPRVGIGIIKQSVANTIDVAAGARAELERLDGELPEGLKLEKSFDTSVFVQQSINEVYATLAVGLALVVLVIYLFLGNFRAMLVPVVTVPISLVATAIVANLFGLSINLLTLLALVLAIGLLVDDAIVVLENIVRKMEEEKMPPLLAAYEGARQVGFAVVATTLVLVSVFLPLTFLEGDLGQLFTEFAVTISAAVIFSSLLSLTLSPMVASLILKQDTKSSRVSIYVDRQLLKITRFYMKSLKSVLRHGGWVIGFLLVSIGLTYFLYNAIPSEYTPPEDKGSFFIIVNGPEGATFSYMKDYMDEIERRLLPYVDEGEVDQLLVRAPRGYGNIESFNSGFVIVVLENFSRRRSGFTIMEEMREKLSDLAGVQAFPVMRQGFGSSSGKPIEFVLGGSSYEELALWRDQLIDRIEEENPSITGIDYDYKETKPQIRVEVDYERASELGVSVREIGRTLETLLGSRRVTTYLDRGEEYDVIIEGERDQQRSVASLNNIYVRSEKEQELIPISNLATVEYFAGPAELNRFNRLRSITIEANLADDYSLGEALEYMRETAREILPNEAVIDYRGQSRDYMNSGSSLLFVFGLGFLVTFLVLAAQFESYIHPLVIMVSVPVVVAGGLLGLLVTGGSLNIYSQIGLIILIGLAAKNGILIVEFANQLRDQGISFNRALLSATKVRLRPILMTSLTTAFGALPLIFSSGAGAETRLTIGVVILFGMISATFLTIFVVPSMYSLLARRTGSPRDVTRRLEDFQARLKPKES